MEFVFNGFSQAGNVRLYGFEGVADDRNRLQIVVGADMTLLRKYSIAIQDVPLLCRQFLEESPASELTPQMTFSEIKMRQYAKLQADAREAAAMKKRLHRAPVSKNAGQAWRGVPR